MDPRGRKELYLCLSMALELPTGLKTAMMNSKHFPAGWTDNFLNNIIGLLAYKNTVIDGVSAQLEHYAGEAVRFGGIDSSEQVLL